MKLWYTRFFMQAVTLGLTSEAAIQWCSVKEVLLQILKTSQENTCARVSFLIKLLVLGLQLYLKRDSARGIFL